MSPDHVVTCPNPGAQGGGLDSAPGTYALIFRCLVHATEPVGKLGNIEVEPAYYLYVGSAFGPGGVKSRVMRHCRQEKKKHWHLDYLCPYLHPDTVWFSHDAGRLEHRWARRLATLTDLRAIDGFGCSDCACRSHLFRSRVRPQLSWLSNAEKVPLETMRLGRS